MKQTGFPADFFSRRILITSAVVLLMLTPGAMARADSGMVKVIVPAGSAARLAGVGRLIADRDSYLVYEIPQGSEERLSRGKSLQPRPTKTPRASTMVSASHRMGGSRPPRFLPMAGTGDITTNRTW